MPKYKRYEDNQEDLLESVPEADETTPEVMNNFVGVKVQLPFAGEVATAWVRSWKRDDNGDPVGLAHKNPIIDSHVYNVKFEDGEVTEYTANVIAENIYAQYNKDDHEYVLLE